MHGIIVKQDFAVLAAFHYICLFKNPVITISKVVGCEDCVRERSYHYGGLGAKPSATRKFLKIFSEKKTVILTPFG